MKKHMKKFRVVVSFSGVIGYDIKAPTKSEAEQTAIDMFGDESKDAVAGCIQEVEASDCWEEQDNA